VLRAWLRATADQPETPLFPSRDGGTLTRDAIERRLAQHIKTAQQACPPLRSKRVTMHTMRHTAAMNLLTSGVDTSTIALWLGHEQERTMHIYLHADLELKQHTLDRMTPPQGHPGRYRAHDTLLAFLESL
jgi:site-specific recombinase XerD